MTQLQYRRNAQDSIMFVGGTKNSEQNSPIVIKNSKIEKPISVSSQFQYYFKNLAGI